MSFVPIFAGLMATSSLAQAALRIALSEGWQLGVVGASAVLLIASFYIQSSVNFLRYSNGVRRLSTLSLHKADPVVVSLQKDLSQSAWRYWRARAILPTLYFACIITLAVGRYGNSRTSFDWVIFSMAAGWGMLFIISAFWSEARLKVRITKLVGAFK